MKTQRPNLLVSLLSATLLFQLRPIPAVGDPEATGSPNATEFIRTSCGTTLYPDLCYTSLSRYAIAIQQNPARLAKVAVGVSLKKVQVVAAYVSNITHQADYGPDPRAAAALHDCFTNFGDAVDEIRASLKQLRQLGAAGAESFRFQMSNVQTWMSAALTDEDTCVDGFQDVKDCPVKSDVSDRVAKAQKFTSNALALVNSYAAKGTP